MQCVRCGSLEAHDYAPDGQSYCSACIFYGMNKPCWKCRMYLPSTELQLYRGQWTCPYCIMDLQDEERRVEARAAHRESGGASELHIDSDQEGERCDRCRRRLSVAYIFNGKKLCENCVEQEKDEWKEQGGGGAPAVMRLRVKGNEGMFSKLVTKLAASISDMVDERRKKKSTGTGDSERAGTKEEKKGERDKKPILTPLAFRERIPRQNATGPGDSDQGPNEAEDKEKVNETDDKEVGNESGTKEKQEDKGERKEEFGKFFDSKKKERK